MSNEINLIIDEINSYSQFSDIDIEKIVDVENGYAFKIAKFLRDNNFKSNQLKKFIEYIKRIERSDKEWSDKRIEFYLLKPRLAMGVNNKMLPPEVFDVLIAVMNLIDISNNNKKNFENFRFFVYFFESIVAYQKFLEANDV